MCEEIPSGMKFTCNELLNFPMKFGVKFTTLFPSSQFDCQLRNEIAKFVGNFGNPFLKCVVKLINTWNFLTKMHFWGQFILDMN